MPYYVIEFEDRGVGNEYYKKRFESLEEAIKVAEKLFKRHLRVTIWFMGDPVWYNGRECH